MLVMEEVGAGYGGDCAGYGRGYGGGGCWLW